MSSKRRVAQERAKTVQHAVTFYSVGLKPHHQRARARAKPGNEAGTGAQASAICKSALPDRDQLSPLC